MISVTVNDKEFTTEQVNLSLFLQEIGFDNLKELALAINERIVPKNQISEYELKNNDRVTLIRITCGG